MITQPNALGIDGRNYPLLKLAGGRTKSDVILVPTQPGAGGVANPHVLYWHSVFCVSRRYSTGPQGGQGLHD